MAIAPKQMGNEFDKVVEYFKKADKTHPHGKSQKSARISYKRIGSHRHISHNLSVVRIHKIGVNLDHIFTSVGQDKLIKLGVNRLGGRS